MSLRSNANLVRNATQVDPPENDEDRIGGLFQDIADVAETVDTIADLRAFDTTILTEGDVVAIRAHNTTGLNKGFGSGKFVWRTTPIFTMQESVLAGYRQPTVSALTRGLSGNGEPGVTNKFFGDNLVFEDGGTGTVVCKQQASSTNPPDEVRSFGRGSTEPTINFDDDVASGQRAFFADDDGVYIRPTFVGFDGLGYWERVLPKDASVTYTMYGAIPEYTFRNANPYDSTSAIQKAEDSLFDVEVTGGHYYITSTIIHRRPKDVHFTGSGISNHYNPDAYGRSEMYLETNRRAYIFSDLNIDLYEVRSSGNISANFNCRLISGHNKRAVRINASERIAGQFEIIVHGDITDFLSGADVTSGTRAFEVDCTEDLASEETYANGGAFSFNTINLAASNCYSGFTATTQAGGNFTNSLDIKIIGKALVKAFESKGNMTKTTLTGWYQEDNNIPNDDTIPLIYFDASTGNYINFSTFDTSKPNSHAIFLDIDSDPEQDIFLGKTNLGPKVIDNVEWSKITSRSFQFIDLASRLSGGRPVEYSQFQTIQKRLERDVTSSEILSSNTTPITLLAGGAEQPAVIIKQAYIKDMSGNTQYSTNTNMLLQANPDAGRYRHTAGSIDLSDLEISTSDSLNIPITEPPGNVNASNSATSVIRLITENGDPTGGDAVFTIVVDYIEV